ncbi:MAG: CBS domain-containing protein [archaeon]|nr:CBS domain-containing protein [archaeon]
MQKDKISKIEHPTAKDLLSIGTILPSSAKLGDLLRVMHINHLSAVIITDGEPIQYYIITHSDIIAFLYNINLHQKVRVREEGVSTRDHKKLPNINDIPLSSIMHGPIGIFDEDLSIDIIIREMANRGYKRLLVGKKGQPSGIINVEDILAWNNLYFKSSKPIMLIILDNESSIIIGKHIFQENVKEDTKSDLIELFGGALQSISAITEEIFTQSGEMRILRKDNYTILFEPRDKVTGIMICDNNSIQLRSRLHIFTSNFCVEFESIISNENFNDMPKMELDIKDLAMIFLLNDQ